MEILKSILKILFGLVLLILVITFFLPSQIHVERTGMIKATPDVTFQLINRLPEWEKWSPWQRMDPNIKLEYSQQTEGKGAMYKWTSTEVGNGKMDITDSKPTEYIKAELDFMENGKGTAEFFLRPMDGGTEVKWTMDTDVGMNPIGRIFGLFMDKMIGADYEKGLHLLDSVAQITKPEEFRMKLEMGNSPAQKLILIKATAKEVEIGQALGEIYSKIQGILAENKLQMAGAPLAIYEEPVNGVFTFEAGLPVDRKPEKPLPSGVTYKEMPSSEAAVCHFFGPYEKTAAAYPALDELIKSKGKSPAGNPYESYLTDPETVKNPIEIQTDIYWPVQ